MVMLLQSLLPNITFPAAVSEFCNRGSKFGRAFTLFRSLRMRPIESLGARRCLQTSFEVS